MKAFLVPTLRPLMFIAVAVLSGCTMIPNYERPAAPVAAEYPGVTEPQVATAAADISWRDFVAEERLQQLIELALANNRDLRVALLNVEQSRAQYRITRSSSVPRVDAGGGFTRQRTAGITAEQWSADVGTTAYEIDLFGRVRSLNEQALERYFATEEAQRSAQISLVAEVAIQYFALRQAQEQLLLARQTLAAVEESYSLNKATTEAGATSELDLRTAEGQVQTAKINVLTYEREATQAHNALVLLVGQTLPTDLSAPRAFSDNRMLADIPAGLPAALVQRRPDILAAEHTLKAANADIGAARAAFFPSLSFTGSIGSASTELSRLFGAGTGAWSFAPQITVPLFTGGQLRAELDVAQVSMRIEVANYEKAIQVAFREVADALIANSSYTTQIQAEAALINAQQIRFDLANARYRQGEDSYLNVLSAQRDLYSAQQGLLQTQYDKLASQISLYKALGGGWK